MKSFDDILFQIENFFVPIHIKEKRIDHIQWMIHSSYYQKKHSYLLLSQCIIFSLVNILFTNILIIGLVGTIIFFNIFIVSLCLFFSVYYNLINIFKY
jgi:hypothetical protein